MQESMVEGPGDSYPVPIYANLSSAGTTVYDVRIS